MSLAKRRSLKRMHNEAYGYAVGSKEVYNDLLASYRQGAASHSELQSGYRDLASSLSRQSELIEQSSLSSRNKKNFQSLVLDIGSNALMAVQGWDIDTSAATKHPEPAKHPVDQALDFSHKFIESLSRDAARYLLYRKSLKVLRVKKKLVRKSFIKATHNPSTNCMEFLKAREDLMRSIGDLAFLRASYKHDPATQSKIERRSRKAEKFADSKLMKAQPYLNSIGVEDSYSHDPEYNDDLK